MGEFRIDRSFTRTQAGIVRNLQIAAGIGADRRESAIRYVIVGDTDPVGEIGVDAIAPLAGAAVNGGYPPDSVVRDNRILRAALPAMNQNAAVLRILPPCFLLSGDRCFHRRSARRSRWRCRSGFRNRAL